MIFDPIYNDIPPQMKNLNIVISILMYFLTKNIEMHFFFFSQKVSVGSDVYPQLQSITSDFAHNVGFPMVYRRIYCGKF